MRSLLHRARQAHRCGCRACSTVVQGASKRASVARRKPTFAEIFTAAYSSVFATAAVIDAVRKDERRRELDRKLDEAQRELDELRENAPDASGHDIFKSQQAPIWEQMKRVYEERPFKNDINDPVSLEASELLDYLRTEYYGAKDSTTLRNGHQLDYDLVEQAAIAEEHDHSLPRLEPQNGRQLRRELEAVQKLVKLLIRQLPTLNPDAKASPTWSQLRARLDSGNPQFSYPSIDRLRSTQNVSSLNEHIRQIIADTNIDNSEKILRICYNLVISPYAPNTHTYNTLILGLDRIGLHKASNVVVQSFFYDRLIKPTPCTSVAVLNHYKCAGDGKRFMRTIARITGLDPIHGAKAGRRSVASTQNCRVERTWVADAAATTTTGRHIYQHAPLNRHVVEELIRGLLHFQLFKSAASMLMQALSAGIHLSTSVVHQVLDECISALDWQGTVELVRGFALCHKQLTKRLTLESNDSMVYISDKLSILHDLLGLGQGPQGQLSQQLHLFNIPETAYKGLEAMMGSLQLNSTVDSAQSKSNLLRIESLSKDLSKVHKATRTIEHRLLHPKFQPEFRQAMLLHLSQRALSSCTELDREVNLLMATKSQSLSLKKQAAVAPSNRGQQDRDADDALGYAFEKRLIISPPEPKLARSAWAGSALNTEAWRGAKQSSSPYNMEAMAMRAPI
ncbi:hypothetical protein VHEMI07265 [[Torrubiella] hemipterigena]|uniref:Pentatricopeptide repeat domain-containing protein n=1 Tax=[Torrubiella] hemipterigena TaxID=1531966 RepID=A0A0A1TLC3_9HYPO|nr:hypothetical protein VHEMI07265 [[Torrubiella] hemipterigena]